MRTVEQPQTITEPPHATPTIHLNGTNRDRLIDAMCDVTYAIDKAYKLLCQTAPNGRDYYPQGPGALEAATEQHQYRQRLLDACKRSIELELERISE